VIFDPKVRNPGRIWRAYGTVNRKGLATPERPHRMATVSLPSRWEGVSPRQVNGLANSYARQSPPTRSRSPVDQRIVMGAGDYRTLDVVSWMSAHGAYKRQIGRKKHAVRCPWCEEHSTPDEPGGTDTVVWEAFDACWPRFCCSHAHCEGRSIADVMALWGDADRFCARAFRRPA
jgi:hypothetical protein